MCTPVAVAVFAPEEVAIVEASEHAFTVNAPAAIAQVVGAYESAVAVNSPHDVNSVVGPEDESASHRVNALFCFFERFRS